MTITLAHSKFAVVQPTGHLNAATTSTFQKQLDAAVRDNETSRLLVDMSQVDFMDSAGLMALVSSLKLSRSLNCRLSLCSVLPSIRILLELTQLDDVFEVFEDRVAFEKVVA